MAIAVDAVVATTNSNTTALMNFSVSVASANEILIVSAGSSSTDPTLVTYNAVSMTKIDSVNLQTSWSSLWYLVNPATGSNNVAITCVGVQNITGGAVSITGASLTGIPDSQHKDSSQTGSVTSYSQSTTVVANNSFMMLSGRANGGNTLTGGTNTTVSQPEVGALGNFFMYSTTPVSSGSQALTCTSSAQMFFGVMASFAPAGVTSTQGLFLVL